MMVGVTAYAQVKAPHNKTLPIGFGKDEPLIFPVNRRNTRAPNGRVHSLGEWEKSAALMTLWNNPSFLRALSTRVKVKILADNERQKRNWQSWFEDNSISQANIDYYLVPTNTIWVRDYGPLFILHEGGKFGVVDTVYNRPRPQDDEVPEFVAKKLGLPLFRTGLVHTGGNYYSDGVGNGFSSTLVYTENDSLTQGQIHARMEDYLGLEQYLTSDLSPEITIEHLDTFGKLVAPDTWIWSEFPVGSVHRQDSEDMLAKIKKLKSPYGTPYKIFRMKMIKRPFNWNNEDYRAYINSVMSNNFVFFPTYGNDQADKDAQAVYEKALPGYTIVPVDAGGTEWGDSVHCRSRNLYTRNNVFIFPKVRVLGNNDIEVSATVYPSPGASLVGAPEVQVEDDRGRFRGLKMGQVARNRFKVTFTPDSSQGRVSFYVRAQDSKGLVGQAPRYAPKMLIDLKL